MCHPSLTDTSPPTNVPPPHHWHAINPLLCHPLVHGDGGSEIPWPLWPNRVPSSGRVSLPVANVKLQCSTLRVWIRHWNTGVALSAERNLSKLFTSCILRKKKSIHKLVKTFGGHSLYLPVLIQCCFCFRMWNEKGTRSRTPDRTDRPWIVWNSIQMTLTKCRNSSLFKQKLKDTLCGSSKVWPCSWHWGFFDTFHEWMSGTVSLLSLCRGLSLRTTLSGELMAFSAWKRTHEPARQENTLHPCLENCPKNWTLEKAKNLGCQGLNFLKTELSVDHCSPEFHDMMRGRVCFSRLSFCVGENVHKICRR